MTDSKLLTINLEFAGGAELLVKGHLKHQTVSLPQNENINWNLKSLAEWIRDNLVVERPELFFCTETVRPGILVLVNDVDWELLGEKSYKIQNNDTVTFISTLHGG